MTRLFTFIAITLLTFSSYSQNRSYPKVNIDGKEFYRYEVQAGEGLLSIARTFSVSIDEVLKYNPTAKDGLKKGQSLNIPVPKNNSIPTLDQNSFFYHNIERGETVYSLAAMYNTSVEEIYKLNPNSKEGITEGAVLKIPQRKIISDIKEENYRYHTISPKETLYSVSRTYSLSPEDVITANPGLSVNTFQIGKTIRIPFFESNETFSAYTGPVITEKKEHKVKRGETFYNIAQQYGISVDRLKKENPNVSVAELATNTVLIIPLEKVDKELERLESANESKANVLLANRKPLDRVNVMQVGLLMPFLEENNGQNVRIQEYYEGFLLAVEKLKKQGANLELYVFDIGTENNTAKLESLLTTLEIQNLDLIIGGVSDKQIKVLSDFSKEKNIKYVIPFSSKNTEVLNNGFAFQVNTPQSNLYTKASQIFVNEFKNTNIIFATKAGDNKKDNLIAIMQDDLKRNNIPFVTIDLSGEFDEKLISLLDSYKKNILIPSSAEIGVVGELLGYLNLIKEESLGYNIHLFGYPEWQTYESNYLRDYHNHGTYFYSSFYVNRDSQEVKDFQQNFNNWYKRRLKLTYPQYAMLGYDTSLFFLTALHKYGRNFEYQLNNVNVKTLQFAFNFERVNNWGGFINTGMYLINYDTGSRIIKSDKSK